jgi:hypothetical protein
MTKKAEKEKYEFTNLEVVKISPIEIEEGNTPRMLHVYARIPLNDGGCGADGGNDGGPPFC